MKKLMNGDRLLDQLRFTLKVEEIHARALSGLDLTVARERIAGIKADIAKAEAEPPRKAAGPPLSLPLVGVSG